jgi:hypothetical protein
VSYGQVVGGGYSVSPGGEGKLIPVSEGKVGNGWQVRMFNTDTTNTHIFVAFAECMPSLPTFPQQQ